METLISKDGTRIAWEKTGKGPSLILVDGAFCSRKYGVSPHLVPLLATSYTVYFYDRRGRGQSSDTPPYSVDKEIDDLKALAELAGPETYACGFSSGAALLLKAVNSGMRAQKIALYEPPYIAVIGNLHVPPPDAEEILRNLVAEGKRGEAVKYFMSKVMSIPDFFIFLFKVFNRSAWKQNVAVANTLPYELAIMGDFSVPEYAATSVLMPVLIIGGEKSPPELKKGLDILERLIPQSESIWLKGSSHKISMAVLAPRLRKFFREDERLD